MTSTATTLADHVGDAPIGITGADGFLGWHLRCRLVSLGQSFITAGRDTLADPTRAKAFAASAPVIFHLAGVNRADDDEAIRSGNVDAAKAVADAVLSADAPPVVIFANTTKIEQPGVYGDAKAQSAQILKDACASAGSTFVDVIFPHLFGEFGRPYYNSGVTTFAYELARGLPSQVNDGELELLHAQDAAGLMIEMVELAATTTSPNAASADRSVRAHGRPISVPDAYQLLASLAEPYVACRTFPDIDDAFELRMFNMLRSQMWPDAYPFELTRHADHRGAFFEVTRSFGQGQTSISTTVPGVIRGEHFHFDKVERFVVISGKASIRVRRLFDAEVSEFSVDGDRPVVIDMPPLCTHDITNTGPGELVTLFWSHDHFNPASSDTYPLAVVGEDLPA